MNSTYAIAWAAGQTLLALLSIESSVAFRSGLTLAAN